MSRFALIGLAAAGCFYTDPINQRPSLDIDQIDPKPVYRGDTVKLGALSHDPEGQFVWFHWRAYLCSSQTDCDAIPHFESSEPLVEVPVLPKRLDGITPTLTLHVILEGTDDYGATARPAQQLWIAVDDHRPTLELRAASSYGNVVTMPIHVYAKVGDPDDWPRVPKVTWTVFSPSNQPAYDFVDEDIAQDPADPTHAQLAKLLTPKGIGTFKVQVTVDDELGLPTSVFTDLVEIDVHNDNPPCLSQLSPLVAAAPAAYPMSEPTLFQVHVVADDLDPYPTVNDVLLGTTKFTWSLLAPGGTRQVLSGVTGNKVALDPASYQPGDILELRVEIADRNNTPITCDSANATCSVIADNNCLQRQTWRVEVR